jgi:hypothetical protein
MAGALAVIGTVASTVGTVIGGISSYNASKAQAKAMEIEAQQRRASSQRQAEQKSKEANLIMSRQLAVAAASGSGASDPTVVDLMSRTAGEGAFQASTIRYGGEEEARGLQNQASFTRAEGRNRLFASFIDSGSTMLGGANAWQKYKMPSLSSGVYSSPWSN